MRLADQLINLSPQLYDSAAWLQRAPDFSVGRTWSWLEVKLLTASVASFLTDHAVAPGERVVNLGRSSLEWVILDLACSTINAIHVPLDPRMPSTQREICLEQVEPSLVFSNTADSSQLDLGQLSTLPSTSRTLEQVAMSFRPEHPANILFTSGTTGGPRGVILSHRNLVSNAIAKLDAMPQFRHDHRLSFLPFSHAYARTCEVSTWLMSYSCMEVVSSIEGVLAIASEVNPTLINGVPWFYERLCEKWDTNGATRAALQSILGDRIRQLASGGAAIPHSIRAKFAAVGLPVYQGYGLTESSPVVCSNRSGRPEDGRSSTLVEVGPPVDGVKIRIDGDSRLWVSGDGVMVGYWKDSAATQLRIADGWLDTGDLAEYVLDPDPAQAQLSVRILGRADDTIVLSNGYKIVPMPIEQILNSESWVSSCVLVGKGFPYPLLILRPAESGSVVSSEEVLAKVERLLVNFPRHEIPRKVLLVNERWSVEDGTANFKGGLIRTKIEALLQDRIRKAYCESDCASQVALNLSLR